MPNFLEQNLKLLRERFPEIADFAISMRNANFGILKAKDGGLLYAVKGPDGNWQPLSNPVNPIEASQQAISLMSDRLTGGMCPAVIVGIAPGYALDTIYQLFKSQASDYRKFRQIYVLANSPLCLCAWLALADREELLKRPEIEFHLATKADGIARLCEEDHTRSHLFIPVSELPPQLTEQIIAPLSSLYLKREAEAETWRKENEEYYDAFSDESLLNAIQGKAGRKPRLMMPTHTSSTVIQFSTRDTCELFEEAGWETRIVKIERDLPPWRLVKEIHEFKPDLFLFIDHLRTEDADKKLYPDKMLFATWVQDTLPAINSREAADEWNKRAAGRNRDFLIGYVDQLFEYGYERRRLINMSMVVNKNLFHPVELSANEKARYGCEVCFASNRGATTESVTETHLWPELSKRGFSLQDLANVHDELWMDYRNGLKYTCYGALKSKLLAVSGFKDVFRSLDPFPQDSIVQRVFWLLNDLIYRYVVLEWLDEAGFDMKLYGRQWREHPRFGKFAAGAIEHGPELNKAYNGAKLCLHLNAMEGDHQRLEEIIEAGARLLTRGVRNQLPDDKLGAMLVKGKIPERQDDAKRAADFLFNAILCQLIDDPTMDDAAIASSLCRMAASPSSPGETSFFFETQKDLASILDEIRDPRSDSLPRRLKNPQMSAYVLKLAESISLAIAPTAPCQISVRPPNTWGSLVSIALQRAANYRYDEAKAICAEASKLDAKAMDSHARVAWNILHPQWLFKEALDWFELDIQAGRLSDAMRKEYVKILAANGHLEKAVSEVEKYYGSLKWAKDGFSHAGEGCLYAGRFEDAYELYKRDAKLFRRTPSQAEAFAAAAICASDFDMASQIVATAGISSDGIFVRAMNMLLRHKKERQFPWLELARFIQNDISTRLPQTSWCSYWNLIRAFLFAADYGKAEDCYREAIGLFPDYKPVLRFLKASFQQSLGFETQSEIESIAAEPIPPLPKECFLIFWLAWASAQLSLPRHSLAYLSSLNEKAPKIFLPPRYETRYVEVYHFGAIASLLGEAELSRKCVDWAGESCKAFEIFNKIPNPASCERAKFPKFAMPWEL